MVNVFFWTGIVVGLWMFWQSVTKPGNDKLGAVSFPFLMLVAAAVATYIGH